MGIFGLMLILNVIAIMIVGSGVNNEFLHLVTLVVLIINIIIFALGVFFVNSEDDD